MPSTTETTLNMNWRKPLALIALRLTRPEVSKHIDSFKRVESMTNDQLQEYHEQRLEALLQHAYQTVPYYRELLRDSGVVIDTGEIRLDRYSDAPLLTRAELRNQSDQLQSTDPGSNIYRNTSGGTTGEPVEFLQDEEHLARGNATRMYYHRLAGRELGEPWVKLWGDESELLKENTSLKSRVKNIILNRHVMNSYRMGESNMREHIESMNTIQPANIEAYVESIYELSKFIREEGLTVHSPNGILSTAGTLTEPMREVVEDAFGTTVLDKYGSREVGTVACECPEQEGLHVFSHTHYVEIVDDNGDPVDPGEEGKIVITPLTNYTMPLIRYEIGDMAVKAETECPCDLPFPTIESVTGRVTDHFVTTGGELVYPGYLRKQLYHEPWVKKYQIHQTKTDLVVYRVVLDGGKPPQETIDNVRTKTRSLLGEKMTVEFEYVDQIKASESGKFRYTISDVVE